MTPALRRLLAAQVPADFADLLDFVAIGALLTFHWQVQPVVFAWLAVAMGLPYLVIGPMAGALTDRMPVRAALIGSNIGRGAATALLALAPDWPSLLVLVALRNSADTFFTPARQAALQALAPGALGLRANGQSHAINQASKIIAPSLGGLALLWLAPSRIFLVNALLSLLAAALLLRLPDIARPAASPVGMIASLREGLAELRAKPLVARVLGLMALGYFAMFFYDTLIPPLMRDLGQTATGLGLAIGAVGAGGVAGALALGQWITPKQPLLWIAGAAALSAAMVAALGLAGLGGRNPGLPAIAAAFAVLGFATACSLVPTRVILQAEVAPDRIGRVTALAEAANALAMLLAPFLGAAVAGHWATGAAFVAGALCLALLSLAALFARWRA